MSDVAIRAEGLGKQYRFGAQAPQQNLREALTRISSAPFRAASRLWPGRRPTSATDGRKKGALFWALKDVSFEVRQGELGYDPTVPSGCFSVQSRLLNRETANGITQ